MAVMHVPAAPDWSEVPQEPPQAFKGLPDLFPH